MTCPIHELDLQRIDDGERYFCTACVAIDMPAVQAFLRLQQITSEMRGLANRSYALRAYWGELMGSLEDAEEFLEPYVVSRG